MISFESTRSFQLLVFGALRKLVGEHRRRQSAAFGRLARREQRDEPARAVDQLQVGDEVANLLERLALEQRLAFDHDQHVVFGRREAARHLLELPELRRVRAEQLAQRIVDLQPADAERRRDAQDRQNDRGEDRRAQRNEADALDAERDVDSLAPARLGGFTPCRFGPCGHKSCRFLLKSGVKACGARVGANMTMWGVQASTTSTRKSQRLRPFCPLVAGKRPRTAQTSGSPNLLAGAMRSEVWRVPLDREGERSAARRFN